MFLSLIKYSFHIIICVNCIKCIPDIEKRRFFIKRVSEWIHSSPGGWFNPWNSPSLNLKCSSLVTFKDIVQYTKLKLRSSSLWGRKKKIREISAIYDKFEDWSLKVTIEPSYAVMLNCNLTFDLKMAEFRGFFYAQMINQHYPILPFFRVWLRLEL